jgi:hypothetical protein
VVDRTPVGDELQLLDYLQEPPQSPSEVYFAHYLCTVYLPTVSPASPAKEALHTGAPNPCTLSLQCIPMRPLHPTPPSAQLSHRIALPVLAHPLCGLRCSLRPALARPTPAPTLRCSLTRPLCGLQCSLTRPASTRLPDGHPDARPPNTRPVPASHLLESGDGSEARHGAMTSVVEHGARRNWRRAVGEEDGGLP